QRMLDDPLPEDPVPAARERLRDLRDVRADRLGLGPRCSVPLRERHLLDELGVGERAWVDVADPGHVLKIARERRRLGGLGRRPSPGGRDISEEGTGVSWKTLRAPRFLGGVGIGAALAIAAVVVTSATGGGRSLVTAGINGLDYAPPDMVLYNGKIATQNSKHQVVQAIAIRDGNVLATGTN